MGIGNVLSHSNPHSQRGLISHLLKNLASTMVSDSVDQFVRLQRNSPTSEG